MSAIGTLSVNYKSGLSFQASNPVSGADYSPIGTSGNPGASISMSSAIANAVAGGGDQCISYNFSLAANTSTTLDVSALTNVMSQTATLVRIKGYQVRLLSTTNDSTLGTAANTITCGSAAANQQLFELAGATNTYNVNNGGVHGHSDPSAGGFAAVSGSAKNFKITNLDTAVAAEIQLSIWGGSS